jgi:hypothetical protein
VVMRLGPASTTTDGEVLLAFKHPGHAPPLTHAAAR